MHNLRQRLSKEGTNVTSLQVRVFIEGFVGETDHPEIVSQHFHKWLTDYDPTTERVGSVSDPRLALCFPSHATCHAFLMRYTQLREDGKPDRPITAFKLRLVCATPPN
jgi:hypothetical protein